MLSERSSAVLFETAEHCVVRTVVCCFVRNGRALCCRNSRVLFLFETAECCVVGTVVCCFV